MSDPTQILQKLKSWSLLVCSMTILLNGILSVRVLAADEQPPAATPPALPALQDQVQQLTERIQELEEQSSENKDHASDQEQTAQHSFEPSSKIYGFMQFEYAELDPENAELNIESESPNLKFSGVNLYFDFLFAPQWRSLIEVAMDEDPETEETELDLERAWFNYALYSELQFQLGIFIPPHGIYAVDHASYVLPTIRVPLDNSFPEHLTGIQLHGVWSLDLWGLQYHLYIANAPGSLDSSVQVLGSKLKVFLKTRKWLQRAFIGLNLYDGFRTVHFEESLPGTDEGDSLDIQEQRQGLEGAFEFVFGDWIMEIQGERVKIIDVIEEPEVADLRLFHGLPVPANKDGFQHYAYLGARWKDFALYTAQESFIFGYNNTDFNVAVTTLGGRYHWDAKAVLKVEKNEIFSSRKEVQSLLNTNQFHVALAIGF